MTRSEYPFHQPRRISLQRIVVGIAIPLAVAFITMGAHYVWGLKASTSSVDSLRTTTSDIREQLKAIKTAVDSGNLRLTQIQCGNRIESGCR